MHDKIKIKFNNSVQIIYMIGTASTVRILLETKLGVLSMRSDWQPNLM